MSTSSGVFYEEKAVEFLKLKGYKILERNFRSYFGEIDIIAKSCKFVSFVEVKMRSVNSLFSPKEAIDRRKRNRIRKTALFYAQKHPNESFRFDVLEIVQGKNWRQYEFVESAFLMNE